MPDSKPHSVQELEALLRGCLFQQTVERKHVARLEEQFGASRLICTDWSSRDLL